MVVSSVERHCENHTDIYPLLMDREHIIDITRSGEVSSSTTTHDDPVVIVGTLLPQNESRPSISTNRASVPELPFPSSNPLNSRNPSFLRRGGENGRRRSPLNSVVWISIELLLTLSQIIASIVVLSLSRHEHPHSPLRAWIIGYASGCVAIIPLLYWRFCHRNQGSEQDSVQSRQNAGLGFSLPVRTSEEEDQGANVTTIRNSQNAARLSARIKVLVEYFKMMLDCFFAVWFVVGNVWIFGGHGAAADAPNLYRLCIVFLTFSCLGYAMPFILCATICCCLPCIISVLGFSEDLVQTRGATTESINSLPTYKFKLKKKRNGHDKETNSSVTEGGGIVAAGTDKERVISGDDAVCCICLAKYANNDELRELPCSHFFHKDCVDKWLKINALCPLCKAEVGSTVLEAMSRSNTTG